VNFTHNTFPIASQRRKSKGVYMFVTINIYRLDINTNVVEIAKAGPCWKLAKETIDTLPSKYGSTKKTKTNHFFTSNYYHTSLRAWECKLYFVQY